MTKKAKEILVWSEKPALMAELLAKARRVADVHAWQVSALVMEDTSFNLSASMADVVYQAATGATGSPDRAVAILSRAVSQAQPALVLVAATKFGLEVAPRVSERIKSGYAAWVLDFEIDSEDDKAVVKSMLFSGIGLATYRFKPQTVLMSVAAGVFEVPEGSSRAAEVILLDVAEIPDRLTVLEMLPKAVSGTRLEDADLVIDVGQGVKQREDLDMIRALAELLNGKLGCTRPVATDRDWFPEWLGLSGLKISPELCLTIGVSGQIQHIVGIRGSRVIAAVNKDENAAIFSQADYGVVADLYEFLPVLTERIKTRGVKPAWLESYLLNNFNQ